MAPRPRISITLHEPWSVYLGWYAAEQSMLPAEVAREMIELGLERTRSDPDLRRRYEEWIGRGGDDPEIQADVVAALQIEGVPHVLMGVSEGAPPEILRAARYLGLISVWLADERPRAEKGAPPRLAEVLSTAPVRRNIAPALEYARGADGATVRAASSPGRADASDKRRLSDSAPQRKEPVLNAWE